MAILCLIRDSTIVSLADTGTSILAGITIFSILGNLAYESGKPIADVVKGGTGLAFVSYPEAIAKFDVVPQVCLLALENYAENCFFLFFSPN